MAEPYTDAKNKNLLNHEQGQGSACQKCGPKCPGLDLHFWRKVCKNCGCKFEDHDVRINEKVHETIVHNLMSHAGVERGVGKSASKGQEQKKPNAAFESSRLPAKPSKPPVSLPSKKVAPTQANDSYAKPKDQEKVTPISSSNKSFGDDLLSELGFLELELKSMEAMLSPQPKGEEQPDSLETFPPPLDEEESSNNAEESSNEAEERARQLALVTQLPPQDFDPEYCHNLSSNEREEMSRFTKKMQDEAFGQGSNKTSDSSKFTCADCDRSIEAGEEYVLAQRIPNKTWHSECFKCHVCHQLLIDLMYFYRDDDIYCGRHYAELMKVRCAACDELIFDLEYTQAEGKDWHTKHFCCFECEVLLGGHSYVLNNSQPYCIECYHLKVADRCFACKLPIQVGSERISYEEKNWHNDPTCFSCNFCGKSMIDLQFLPKGERIFCSGECALNTSI